jgi:diketogulonate reductase-like aldo/keto reductase
MDMAILRRYEVLQNSDVVSAVNQVEFHPFLYDKESLNFCKNNRIQLEAYNSPEARNSIIQIWQNTDTGADTLELTARRCCDSKINT